MCTWSHRQNLSAHFLMWIGVCLILIYLSVGMSFAIISYSFWNTLRHKRPFTSTLTFSLRGNLDPISSLKESKNTFSVVLSSNYKLENRDICKNKTNTFLNFVSRALHVLLLSKKSQMSRHRYPPTVTQFPRKLWVFIRFSPTIWKKNTIPFSISAPSSKTKRFLSGRFVKILGQLCFDLHCSPSLSLFLNISYFPSKKILKSKITWS